MMMYSFVILAGLILLLIWGVSIKAPNISLFFFCLGGFCTMVYINNMELDHGWFLFMILLPTLGGLFQLFMQMVSYISGQKTFNKSSISKVSTSLKAIAVILLATLYMFASEGGMSLIDATSANSYNYVMMTSKFSNLCMVCMLIVLGLILYLSVVLKDSNKAMKSSV